MQPDEEPEPTAAAFASELREIAKCIGPERPGLAKAVDRRIKILREAPPEAGGCSWLASRGDEHARHAADFYAKSRSGAWPSTRR